MRSKVLLVSVGLLIAVLALMGTTRADVSHDAAAPVAIPYDQSLDFMVVGSHGGAFAYYSIEYPGDGRIITIELDLAPGDPGAFMAAGFNVYGPNGYFIGSGSRSMTKTDRKELYWSDFNPARWLIQVYNYLDGVPVNYHLQVTGLPEPEPVFERGPVMSPAEAVTFSMASGSLHGDQGGNYHYYNIESGGDGSEVSLDLYFAPDNDIVKRGFGVNVYGPRDGVLVATGGYETNFRLELPGTYLVQIYNYIHGVNITYVLTEG
jgi:hypothetical protein